MSKTSGGLFNIARYFAVAKLSLLVWILAFGLVSPANIFLNKITTTGTSAISPTNKNGYKDMISLLPDLDDGKMDVSDKSNQCFVTKGTDINFNLTMSSTVKYVKTVLLPSFPDSDKKAKPIIWTNTSPSSTWISKRKNVNQGTNDFSSSPLEFDGFSISWEDKDFGLCEIFMYENKNYVPGSTITTGHQTFGTNNALASFYSTDSQYTVINYSDTNDYVKGNKHHTCMYQAQDSTNKKTNLSFLMIDFISPLVITDLHLSGGTETMEFHLVDPASGIMDKTTAEIIDYLRSAAGGPTEDFNAYPPGNVVHQVASMNQVKSAECLDAQCADWGVTRMIISNVQDKNFFLCGFAIMGYPVVCPPTTAQCLHARLMPLPANKIPANMAVAVGGASTSGTFFFPDSLSIRCGVSYCDRTSHSLSCIDCTTCINKDLCTGTCQATAEPAFTYSFTTSANSVTQYSLTVTDDQPLEGIDHMCTIVATKGTQSKSSLATFKIKKSCALCGATTFTTTNVPTFTKIAIGATGQTKYFDAFGDSVTTCGSVCDESEYTLWCHEDTDLTKTFAEVNLVLFGWTQIISKASTNWQIYIQSLYPTTHDRTWICKIRADRKDSAEWILSTASFNVQFSLCVIKAEACNEQNFWAQPPVGWIPPQSFSVFLDDVTGSAFFNYGNWVDELTTKCGVDFCGTLVYDYVTYGSTDSIATTITIPSTTVTITDGSTEIIPTKVKTITVSTSNIVAVGVYKVRIHAKLDGPNAFDKAIVWESEFTITVTNPCTQPNPCQFTTIITPTQVLNQMNTYLDDVSHNQLYNLFTDTVSDLCVPTKCGSKTYSLVYTDTLKQVSSDLAQLDTTTTQIKLKTQNYLNTGVHNVRVKCQINLDNGEIMYGLGVAFNLNVIACHTDSCKFTKLGVMVSPPDTLPTSYYIGLNNVAGTTTFSNYYDTVGSVCTTNSAICGTPTYKLVYTDNTEPTFTTLISGASKQTISAVTTDISLAGDHFLRVKVTFVLPGALPALVAQSNQFNINVDVCQPLPCGYSSILVPTDTGTVLPQEVFVYTNGTNTIASWTPYIDDVSKRCSPISGYIDMCSVKNYVVTKPDGTALPFPVTVAYNSITTLWELSASTTDESLINSYQAIIHASFNTASYLGTDSDNSLHEFVIYVELPNPCIHLNCNRNQLILDRVGFVEPSNFTVDVEMNWNQTYYDSFNDSKNEVCMNQPGSYPDDTAVASWARPVCGFPIYQLVNANTLQPMTALFGAENIDIQFYQDTQYTQQFIIAARTQDIKLDGEHHVKLGVKLNEADQYEYTTPFWIIVEDPCSPYDCAITAFQPPSAKPADIYISVGQGYVTSSQELWDNSVSQDCATTEPLCGDPKFELYLEDGSVVPFTYVVKQNPSSILVNVIITDETMMGETFLVYLRGYGIDGAGEVFGTNGTSSIFSIIVSDVKGESPSYVVSEQTMPIFTFFPQDLDYRTGASNSSVETIYVQATAYSEYGINSMTVNLGSALAYVTYEIDDNVVYFTIQFSDLFNVGLYKIKVEAMDVNGEKVTQSFTITVLKVSESANTEPDAIKVNSDETLAPLTASIESIGLTGLITIGYNRRVIPVTNTTWITSGEFHLTFEQRSYEDDQTEDFRYKVIGMTPQNIYVQMYFKTPLDVSQGLQPDLVHVQMLRNLFMVEDLDGIYSGWVQGTEIEQVKVDVAAIKKYSNYGNFQNTTAYEPLSGIVPKQVADKAEFKVLFENIQRLGVSLETLLWGPLAMHLIGFGSMEYVWIIFSNLQLISCLSQFDLKLPVNFIAFTESYSDLSNANVLPLTQIYHWLKYQTSDSEDPSVSAYGTQNIDMTGSLTQNLIDGGDGRLLNEIEERSEFQQSRFFAKGASERVIETSSQLILLIVGLFVIAISGIALQKSILYLFPARLQKVFHWLRMRIFWCFPMRMLIQNYMCITFASFLNLKYQNSSDSTEQQVNLAFSVCIIIVYSIGFILFICWFTRKYRKQLKRSEMIRRFDSIFMSLELEKKWALPQVGFSLLRKFLLIFVAVALEINLLQFCAALYIQEFYTVYILLVKPMDRPSRNMNEYFNELLIIVVIIILSLFTDYVPDAGIRYSTGLIIIYLVILQITVNTLFLMVDVTRYLKRIFKIFKYKYVIRNRIIEVTAHNTVIDNVDRYKNSTQFETYKKRNPLLQSQLEVINSIGSEPSSSIDSIKLDRLNTSVKVIKTISARKKEFEIMMEDMKEKHPYNQLLTQENANLVKNPQIQREIQLKLQHNNLWPVSPRDVRNEHLPAIDDKEKAKWNWQVEVSRASDWNALPADFEDSNNISVSLFSSDRSRYPVQSEQQSKKSKLIVRQKDQLDYSVPDANQNSKEHSKWKEDDSLIFVESKNDFVNKYAKGSDQKLKVVQESSDEIEWDFN